MRPDSSMTIILGECAGGSVVVVVLPLISGMEAQGSK